MLGTQCVASSGRVIHVTQPHMAHSALLALGVRLIYYTAILGTQCVASYRRVK